MKSSSFSFMVMVIRSSWRMASNIWCGGERRYIYVYRFMHTGCPKSRLTEIVKCLTAITFTFVRWLYLHQLERSSIHYLLFLPAVMSLMCLLVVTFCWWLWTWILYNLDKATFRIICIMYYLLQFQACEGGEFVCDKFYKRPRQPRGAVDI
jgi:hypothetical protein